MKFIYLLIGIFILFFLSVPIENILQSFQIFFSQDVAQILSNPQTILGVIIITGLFITFMVGNIILNSDKRMF